MLSKEQEDEKMQSHNKRNIKEIDEVLHQFYKDANRKDYLNKENIGKFAEFCIDNGMDDDMLEDELSSDAPATSSLLVYFDDNFPFQNKMDDSKQTLFDLLCSIYHKQYDAQPSNHPHHEVLNKKIFRCKVTSDRDVLELLHQKHPWIPGAENIRPTVKLKEDKKSYIENIQYFYVSGMDYIFETVFECKAKMNADGKLYVENKEHIHKEVFGANKFPYQVHQDAQHYIMWYSYSNDSITDQKITDDIDTNIKNIVKHEAYDFIWYINPKMTIPDVFHVQVFWIANAHRILDD
eukprot:142542_1